jgi:hypothetical protein
MSMLIPRPPGIAFIEAQMVDTCTITRDALGVEDAVLDRDTGELTDPSAPETIYSGKCILKEVVTKDILFEQGGQYQERDMMKALLPVTAEGIQLGDVLTLTATAYNADFLGIEMRVFQVQGGTHKVYTSLLVEKIVEDKQAISR